MTDIRPDDAIAELQRCLRATLGALAAEVERNGSPSKAVDEIISEGSIALERAISCGLIARENDALSPEGSFLPVDDDRAPLSDSLLEADVIQMGMHEVERAAQNMANYVSGETIDWDAGMIAVAVYRAMTRQARLGIFQCRLDIDARDAIVEVRGVSMEDAAAVEAMKHFHASKGEWMGGVITVVRGPADADLMDARGIRFDCTIEFDADRDHEPYASTCRLNAVGTANPEVVRFLDAAALLIAPRTEQELAARRFRALMNIGGAHMAGSAGFDPSTGERRHPDMPGCVHMGMEVASAPGLTGSVDWAVNSFKALAEDSIVIDYGKPLEHEVGVSEEDDAKRWEALMRLPRIKVWRHTSARGEDDTSPAVFNGVFAFFAEYWVYGEEKTGAEDDPQLGRECLTLLADTIIAAHRA